MASGSVHEAGILYLHFLALKHNCFLSNHRDLYTEFSDVVVSCWIVLYTNELVNKHSYQSGSFFTAGRNI